MKACMVIVDAETGERIKDHEELMRISGQDPRMGFEAVAIQDDGAAIICDKCGNFGYLDPKRYELRLMMSE